MSTLVIKHIDYNIDFAPEKLDTFNTLLKYGEIEF